MKTLRIAALMMLATALSGCMGYLDRINAYGTYNPDAKDYATSVGNDLEMPVRTSNPYLQQLKEYPPPSSKVVIGVYSFTDKTGQRKSGDMTGGSLSTAVTQGAEVWLIQALKNAGQGAWFQVVERVSLDALTKERQIIRQTRQEYEGETTTSLPPMLFAGALIEGGVISYEANLRSGGVGARFFGIGADKMYREDQVTVALRLVNVQTGEIVLAVSTSKSILSYKNDAGVITYINPIDKYMEGEIGAAENEPVNYAVRTAIEEAVIALIDQGVEQELWYIKGTEPKPPPAPPTIDVPTAQQGSQQKIITSPVGKF